MTKHTPVKDELVEAVSGHLLALYPHLDKGFSFSLARLLIQKKKLDATPAELKTYIKKYSRYPEFKFCHIPRWTKDKLKKQFGKDCFKFLEKALVEPYKAHTKFVVWFLYKSKQVGFDKVLAAKDPYKFLSEKSPAS